MFDFDGVVADSLDLFSACLIEACRECGFTQISGREEFLGLFDSNMYDGMLAAGVPRGQIGRVIESVGRRLAGRLRDCRPFEGMAEVLQKLAEENEIAVVTSNLGGIVSDFMRLHGIDRPKVILGAEEGTSKVEKIGRVMAQHQGRPCYYIGDTKGDILEGRRAGARTVAVTWGWHPVERLVEARPDFTVRSPGELFALFGDSA